MTVIDGRRLRADRSRERVLDAVLAVVAETGDIPTAQQLADHAGMSIRTVFRLFDEMDDLYAEVINNRFLELRSAYLAPSAGLPLEERIEELVTVRCRVHEEISPMRRVVMRLAQRSDFLTNHMVRGLEWLRSQIAETFADELAERVDQAERERLVHALDAALSWETWERLRSLQGHDVDDARDTVALMVRSLLLAPR